MGWAKEWERDWAKASHYAKVKHSETAMPQAMDLPKVMETAPES